MTRYDMISISRSEEEEEEEEGRTHGGGDWWCWRVRRAGWRRVRKLLLIVDIVGAGIGLRSDANVVVVKVMMVVARRAPRAVDGR